MNLITKQNETHREQTYDCQDGWDSQGAWDGQDTLLYFKRIINKGLLTSTGNSVQCYVAARMGEGFGENIHVYVWMSPFTIHLKSSQNC